MTPLYPGDRILVTAHWSSFAGARGPIPESPRASRTVPGVSFADTGFEVVDGKDVFVAWFACPLDACDALKAASEGKIVRCGDRALIKVKNPRRLGR